MISKELKHLSRRELVDIIYQLKKNEQRNQEEITTLEEALQEKRIRVSVAGSIAEAAADVTQIFSVAQETADLYLQEIAAMKEDTQKICSRIISEAQKQAEMILEDAQMQLADLQLHYQIEHKKLQQLQEEMQQLQEEMQQQLG